MSREGEAINEFGARRSRVPPHGLGLLHDCGLHLETEDPFFVAHLFV